MKAIRKPIRAVQAVAVFLFLSAFAVRAADPAPPPPAETPRYAVMTVTHAEIQGQVFLASVVQGEEEKPAPNVRVQIREMDSDKVLREAITDRNGYYSLPKLEPDQYLMIVGRLKLQLDVKPETQQVHELPKTLIVILPEELARDRN